MTVEKSSKLDLLHRDLERLKDLPSAPRVVLEIWSVLGDADASVRALSVVVERDPALSAKILKLANSAYFGLPRPVRDVRTACVVLGFSTIESLAVGVTALDALSRAVSADFDLDGFWVHSVATAIAAEHLARRLGLPEPGVAFCGGIVHDVGKLVLATLSPARYRRVLTEQLDTPLRERESSEFGADHTEVGAWLTSRWRFPPELVQIVRGHHEPDGEEGGGWAVLVAAADAIATNAGWPCPGVTHGRPISDFVGGPTLAIPAEVLEDVQRALPEEMALALAEIGLR